MSDRTQWEDQFCVLQRKIKAAQRALSLVENHSSFGAVYDVPDILVVAAYQVAKKHGDQKQLRSLRRGFLQARAVQRLRRAIRQEETLPLA